MKSHRILLAAPLLLLMLAGCSKNSDPTDPTSNSGTSQDQVELTQQVTTQPDYAEDDGIATSEEQVEASFALSLAADLDVTAGSHPVRFWRVIRDIDRRFEFEFSDFDSAGNPNRAIVTVHKLLRGNFNVLYADSVGPDSVVRNLVHKPLEDRWVRKLVLHRMRLPNHVRSVWRIVGTSGVQVTSKDATTDIVSLRVQQGALDTTITNPLELFRLRQIIQLDTGADVTLTVTTTRADDIVLLYSRAGRARFHNNGDLTYSGTWRTASFAGLRHAGINALSHATLFDPAAAYDSQAWILPYLVRPNDPGDFVE
ncbi:MAG: hypothetical protein HOP12_09930 [Candidatus Eisenbacteria bacterium]|uniref:Uncharacterized protein n=1 Tax=Eiseniibacteriota bacterium TaxID=2212470 RepID=A0A849SR40_UNCEI|nr:hypothetical protein [Candidatus Eisenbacteria bacterium]